MGTLALWVALFMFGALVIYVLTGGADFGGGIVALLARGPRREAIRELVFHALAPIWEANHVWLIVALVLLFVAFPKAFAAMTTALHIPLTVMLIGIVLRGAAFVFAQYDEETSRARAWWQRVFMWSSLMTPVTFGIVVGAVASGRIRVDASGQVQVGFIEGWMALFPFLVGGFAATLFAYLAAIYLTLETDDTEIRDWLRKLALGLGIALGIGAWVTLWWAQHETLTVYDRLVHSPLARPFHLITGLAAVGALGALWYRRYTLARVAAAVQSVAIMVGWGLAQYPALIVPDVTVAKSAAPASVLRPLLFALLGGTVLLVPSFGYLYWVFKQHTLAMRLQNQRHR
nr:cytochrome d ubiquinol oxidase subunit II [Ardenticatena sp.]